MKNPVLSVESLKTYIATYRGLVRTVDRVTLKIHEGETLGFVGESGCGKSMTALSILKLYPKPQGRIIEGAIYLDGEDLVPKGEEEMRKIRGKRFPCSFRSP